MKRKSYISFLLLLVFTVTTLLRVSEGLFCECPDNCHSFEYVCMEQCTGHHSNKCAETHSEAHSYICDQYSKPHDCCTHSQTKEYNAEPPTVQKSVSHSICANYTILYYNYNSAKIDFDSRLNNLKKEYSNFYHCVSSQWNTPSLRRRPPPVLV